MRPKAGPLFGWPLAPASEIMYSLPWMGNRRQLPSPLALGSSHGEKEQDRRSEAATRSKKGREGRDEARAAEIAQGRRGAPSREQQGRDRRRHGGIRLPLRRRAGPGRRGRLPQVGVHVLGRAESSRAFLSKTLLEALREQTRSRIFDIWVEKVRVGVRPRTSPTPGSREGCREGVQAAVQSGEDEGTQIPGFCRVGASLAA